MMMRTLLLVALAAASAHACATVYTGEHARHRSLAEINPACHFSHDQAGRDWPAHDSECSWKCSGKSQSPINVPTSRGVKPLKRKYKANLNFGTATNIRVLNIGHAVQVEFDSPKNNKASVVYYGNSIYTLYNATNMKANKAKRIAVEPLQFHFHATSEHLLSGRSTELELHLVTKLKKTPGVPFPKECRTENSTCLAVFGVMFDITTDPTAKKGDATVQRIIKWLPKCQEAGRECVKSVPHWEMKLDELLPSTDYLTYTGSLTTPPCTEGVMWHVFPKVKATLTQQQALDLQLALSTAAIEGHEVQNRLNNRATQPWNGRNVFYSA